MIFLFKSIFCCFFKFLCSLKFLFFERTLVLELIAWSNGLKVHLNQSQCLIITLENELLRKQVFTIVITNFRIVEFNSKLIKKTSVVICQVKLFFYEL